MSVPACDCDRKRGPTSRSEPTPIASRERSTPAPPPAEPFETPISAPEGLPLAPTADLPEALVFRGDDLLWLSTHGGVLSTVPRHGGAHRRLWPPTDTPSIDGVALGIADDGPFWITMGRGAKTSLLWMPRDGVVETVGARDVMQDLLVLSDAVYVTVTRPLSEPGPAGVILRFSPERRTLETLVERRFAVHQPVGDEEWLYWMEWPIELRGDSGNAAIVGMPRAGGEVRTLATLGESIFPSDLQKDEAHVYWIECPRGRPVSCRIVRMPSSGGALEELVPSTRAVHLVVEGGFLYHTEEAPERGRVARAIVRRAAAGGEPTVVALDPDGVIGLAVADGIAYWANFRELRWTGLESGE